MALTFEKISGAENSKANRSFFPQKEKSKSLFFQPKLTIGPVDDVYEREADAVADRVMRMSETEQAQTKSSAINVQRKCAACEEEEQLQRKEDGNGAEQSEAPSIVSDALGSGGRPLDDNSRSFMENRFGYDFSRVKIHTDTVATKSAQSINALAYTSGNSIVFNEGQYSPKTENGKKLLAHELTHVVQQNKNISTKLIQRYSHQDCTESDLRTHIWPADGIAKRKLDAAIAAVTASPVTATTQALFTKYFMTSTPDTAAIEKVFRKLKTAFDGNNYTYECEEDCDAETNAYSGLVWDIHLCMNNLRGRANDCIARTIIHEFSHKYAGTGHGWYFSTASCYNGCDTAGCPSDLSASDALDNAYSFAGFAHEV